MGSAGQPGRWHVAPGLPERLTMRRRIRTSLLARALTIASLAAAGVVAVPVTAFAAVGNPGSFTFSVTGGSLKLGLLPLQLPTGSMSGQIDSTGAISIPQSSLELTNQPFTFSQNEPLVGTVSASGTVTVDTTSLSGTLNPVTGAASLTTSLFASASVTISVNGATQYTGTCSIGGSDPANHLPATMTTDPPGVPYNDQTGAVTLAANLGNPVSCDPALPSILQFFIDGSAQLTVFGTTTPIVLPDGHLSLTPNPLGFGDVPLGASKSTTVTFSNSGTDDTFITNVAISGQDAADFSVDQTSLTCASGPSGIDVPAGSSCTVAVIFAPSATGDRTASLVATNSSVDGTQTVPLTGTGTNSAVSLATTSLDFGQQVVGTTSQPNPVTVTNSGTTSLTVHVVAASGDFAADASACTAQPVPPGQACVINVTFSPTATGNRSGTLTISSNAASSPDTVALTGTGVAPVIGATPGSLAFGTVPIGTDSSPQNVTVTNSGTSGLHVTGATASGPFAVSDDGCSGGSAVAPGDSCQIGVQFAPAGTGPASGTLTISSDGGTATVALSGSGSPSADLNASIGAAPNPVHRNKDLTYTITVQNAGPSAASGTLTVDQLPANVQFQSLSAPAGSGCITPAVGSTGTVKCSLGSLGAGSSVRLQIVVLVVAPKGVTISDTAKATSNTFDPDLQDNQATVQTAVQ
jgi:uncharacterized repeat protein (TIGR01451 family)